MVSLAIVIEPLRFILGWLLGRTTESLHFTRPPPISDWVNELLTPVKSARQYYAALLRGDNHPRLLLLCRKCLCADMTELRAKHPQFVAQLRRMILCADAWIFRKHEMEADQWPWKLSMIGDSRVSVERQMKVAQELFSSQRCCLDEFGYFHGWSHTCFSVHFGVPPSNFGQRSLRSQLL